MNNNFFVQKLFRILLFFLLIAMITINYSFSITIDQIQLEQYKYIKDDITGIFIVMIIVEIIACIIIKKRKKTHATLENYSKFNYYKEYILVVEIIIAMTLVLVNILFLRDLAETLYSYDNVRIFSYSNDRIVEGHIYVNIELILIFLYCLSVAIQIMTKSNLKKIVKIINLAAIVISIILLILIFVRGKMLSNKVLTRLDKYHQYWQTYYLYD